MPTLWVFSMNSSSFCSFTSSISPKQHHLTPYPLSHVTMSEKKTNGFVYITSDLRNEWTADWRTWARSWKLWKLRPRRSWRTFPILQGRWLPRYADGWMKGRDDSGYRMLKWTCYKHTKSFTRVFDDDECLKMMVVLCLDFLDKLSLFCCASTSRCEIIGESNKERNFLEESMIQSQPKHPLKYTDSIQSKIYLLIIPLPKKQVMQSTSDASWQVGRWWFPFGKGLFLRGQAVCFRNGIYSRHLDRSSDWY